jgi:hypothetical protein
MWFKVKKTAPVVYSEQIIRQYSLRRLAEVFGVPEASLSHNARFGHELIAAPASDFAANAFDIIDGDIKDVADKQILKEMEQGTLVIQTVGDYCEHMVRCSAVNPAEIADILRLPKAE